MKSAYIQLCFFDKAKFSSKENSINFDKFKSKCRSFKEKVQEAFQAFTQLTIWDEFKRLLSQVKKVIQSDVYKLICDFHKDPEPEEYKSGKEFEPFLAAKKHLEMQKTYHFHSKATIQARKAKQAYEKYEAKHGAGSCVRI